MTTKTGDVGSRSKFAVDFQDLFTYLKCMPEKSLQKLFESPAACLSVFRVLPSFAQIILCQMVFLEKPVPRTVIDSWADKNHQNDVQEAVSALDTLGIWKNASGHTSVLAYVMSSRFRDNFRVCLLGGGKPWILQAKSESDPKKTRDAPFLDKYAQERWDCVLNYMASESSRSGSNQVMSKGQKDLTVSQDTKLVLRTAGLMVCDDGSEERITSAGFQFLLMPRPEQVWFFLTHYLSLVESRYACDVSVCLGFLCELSLSDLGQCYNSEKFGIELQTVLQHLRELGIVYQRKVRPDGDGALVRKEGLFYPTRLALGLASGLKNSSVLSWREAEEAAQAGFLIVETNYRVYAYTESELPISLLAMFTEMLHRFPGMVVAVLTRDSVRMALKMGLTAAQIVDFLKMNAHPEMRRRMLASGGSSVIPPTVSDQIHLWEKERDRITLTDGVAYNQFLSLSEYEAMRDFAREKGIAIWESNQRKTVVVAKENHEEMKRFWRKHSRP
ncbi:unnamed protein product [Notodromas monacha]|uniref:General transcription factor IIH subunit 4 n=1 Tax=Notodromas monacha TaxID=399045 RepID=A0A7R9BKN4_9CRUS|nr:unnamed protein product [Notodromas monacha]CAG0916404.1 unnamed protein product [Notodromas monacha]